MTPSIKEALEIARNTLVALRTRLKTEPSVQGRGWVSLGIVTNDAITKADAALATFQPDGERREAIARAVRAFKACRPVERTACQDFGMQQDDILEQQLEAALLASGLVQDEAGIRADEREKCAKIADREVEFWQDAESSSARIVAANIRSARNGGAES